MLPVSRLVVTVTEEAEILQEVRTVGKQVAWENVVVSKVHPASANRARPILCVHPTSCWSPSPRARVAFPNSLKLRNVRGRLGWLQRLKDLRRDVLPIDDSQAHDLVKKLLALFFREGYLDDFRCLFLYRPFLRLVIR